MIKFIYLVNFYFLTYPVYWDPTTRAIPKLRKFTYTTNMQARKHVNSDEFRPVPRSGTPALSVNYTVLASSAAQSFALFYCCFRCCFSRRRLFNSKGGWSCLCLTLFACEEVAKPYRWAARTKCACIVRRFRRKAQCSLTCITIAFAFRVLAVIL